MKEFCNVEPPGVCRFFKQDKPLKDYVRPRVFCTYYGKKLAPEDEISLCYPRLRICEVFSAKPN